MRVRGLGGEGDQQENFIATEYNVIWRGWRSRGWYAIMDATVREEALNQQVKFFFLHDYQGYSIFASPNG